ncbi:transglutaminaseTgpA domain-containing protein [Plantactinospora sp. CA-290183]|uniref:transglutaminaseTgpA domain-containing protein n=1 Tax=Plantactinospora sp. CA-290183 TaxID=3240006 RepID=UPI003D90AF43
MLLWLVPIAVLGGLCWGLYGAVRAVRRRAWTAPGTWVRFAVLAASSTVLLYGHGLFSGLTLDTEETCELVKGQEYDTAYRAEHLDEPGRWFPLHNRCNAEYDLIPAYVNPSLVVLAALTLGCLGVAVVMAIRLRRRAVD